MNFCVESLGSKINGGEICLVEVAVGLGRANSWSGQNWPGFFYGQNFNSPARPKNWAGRAK